jgi:aspartokinase
VTMDEVAVIKVGGSILRNDGSYATAARLIAEQIKRKPTWVVISAAYRLTDALERLAQSSGPEEIRSLLRWHARLTGVPVTSSLESDLQEAVAMAQVGPRDRLLAWGEQASVAAFQSHLASRGVSVPVVELETGAPPPRRHVALVPGFYVRDPRGKVRCFPRGGSDITAVLVALALGTNTIRLWKDGGGIRSNSGTLPEIDSASLLGRLTNSVRPLHPAAVELAIKAGIDLILEDPFGDWPATKVSARSSVFRSTQSIPEALRVQDLPRQELVWERTVLSGVAGGP